MNFYRAPLSFLLSAPKYRDSRDLVPLHALGRLPNRTCRFSRTYGSCAEMIEAQPAI